MALVSTLRARPHADSSEEKPDTVTALRHLAERCRRKDIPDRHELAAVALDLAADARNHVREYVNKEGEPGSYKDPNFNAAHKGIEVAASLIFREKPAGAGKDSPLPLDADVSKLAQMGWRAKPTDNGGVVLEPISPSGERVQ